MIALSIGIVGFAADFGEIALVLPTRCIASRPLRKAEASVGNEPRPMTSIVWLGGPSKEQEAARPVTSNPASRTTSKTGFTSSLNRKN